MTDDLTRPIETPREMEPEASAEVPVESGGEVPAESGDAPATSTSEPVASPIDAPTPAGEPSPAMAAVTPPPAGSNRLRWAIGLGVAGLAVALAVAAVLVFGSRPAPEALKYIPADSAFVVEIRPDLPGDQVQKLGNLLAHFPGFLDQATLPDKLDETFSRIVGQATGGGVDYRADLKPWLSGPAFVALRPAAGATVTDPSSLARGVASLTTTGTVSCDRIFGKRDFVTHETYRGLDLFVGNGAACVLDGRQALLGDTQSVHDALDAHADGKGVDRDSVYQKARGSLQGDQLLTVYINGSAYTSFFSSVMQTMNGTPGLLPGLSPDFMPAFPEWLIEGFRAEDDALVVDVFSAAPPAPTAGATAGPSFLPLPAAHPSVLAPMAPANTLFYLEAQGAGVGVQNMLSVLRTYPQLAPALQMLDGAGGAGQLVGWIEDAGVVVVNGPDGPTGGIMLVAPDDAAAAQRVSTITGLIAFASIGGGNIQTHESTIGGVTVTTVTLGDLGSLVPPGQLPPGFDVPSDARVEFSIAAKGRVVLLGTGESFMNAVLTVQPGAGLVDQANYKQATTRALSGSQLTLYVGIRDIVGLIETALPAEAKGRWETDVKPYISPFQAISITSSATDGGVSHGRFTITISNP